MPSDKIIAGLEQALRKQGLSGAVMEPGYFTAPDGLPLWGQPDRAALARRVAVTQHIIMSTVRYEVIGRSLLGLDPGTPIV